MLAAFFGTLAVVDGRYRDSFLWMIAATLVDATDGVFARYARVKDVLPGFDGARLDDIVDYLTFVFLPVLLLYYAGDLPAAVGSGRGIRRAVEQRVRLWIDRCENQRPLLHRFPVLLEHRRALPACRRARAAGSTR